MSGTERENLAPREVPICEAEKRMLDARLADLEARPEDQSLWFENKERLLRQIP